MIKKISGLFALLAALAMVLSACAGTATITEAPAPELTSAPAEPENPVPGEGRMVLATTTSTQDSGLLDYLLPMFEQEAGTQVDVIAVGSGQALQLGQDGNADVLLVHSPAKEKEFMEAGHGVRRELVMYNDFIIVGPESDLAGIKGMTSAADAFKKLSETQSSFISRGDESGTHSKELAIWKAAGIEPAGDWYVSAGQGMGEVLTMANESQAYTLSDRATYLARQKEGLDLAILVEGDKALFNPYGVITVDPAKTPAIQAALANQFIDWLISVPTQEKISQFGMGEFGQSLFVPDSQPWRDSQ
jgi:tungstate transport system substrate-binding protein